ncbi:MAG: glycosyltransferase, partial [Actinomycetota bacterium]|nr:glycosyltransferase [Actinomycetota bacterium]
TDTERRDAQGLFPLDPERLMTVYHGVSRWTKTALQAPLAPEAYRLPDGSPYVLIVSRLYTHKNHRRLIEAFALVIEREHVNHHLVVAGGDADVTRFELEQLAQRLGVADRVHFLGVVPQHEIPGLFAGASAAAYPSLYETFGHPVLEAFAFGLPLVTSSVGATAEVAAGAAQLVEPETVEDIADGLSAVLTDERLRQHLSEAGRRRVAEFTWERCARETLAVLFDAVDRNKARLSAPHVGRYARLTRSNVSTSNESTEVDSSRQLLLGVSTGVARGVLRKPAELRYHVAREIWSAAKRFGSHSIENIDLREVPGVQDAIMEGYLDNRNRVVLAALCRALGARTFFEVGTNRGRTAWTVARNNPDLNVYTLDLPSPDAPVALDLNDSDRVFFEAWASGEAFHDTPEAERITPLFGDSAVFDFGPYERAMDIVFIDGAHSYSYVRSDTQAALRMLAPGGTIIWDDYPAVPGVYRCLNELAPDLDRPLYHILDTRLVLYTKHELVKRLSVRERGRPDVA